MKNDPELPASEYPIILWLATGNLNGLSLEKCQVLKGRDIMIFPDLGAFENWSLKLSEIQKKHNYKVTISTLLEDEATNSDRANGLDIADYIISELKFPSPRGEGSGVRSFRKCKATLVLLYNI